MCMRAFVSFCWLNTNTQQCIKPLFCWAYSWMQSWIKYSTNVSLSYTIAYATTSAFRFDNVELTSHYSCPYNEKKVNKLKISDFSWIVREVRLQGKSPCWRDWWDKDYQSLIPLGGKECLPLWSLQSSCITWDKRGWGGEICIIEEILVKFIARDKDPLTDWDLIIGL